MRRRPGWSAVAALLALFVCATGAWADDEAAPTYRAAFHAELVPADGIAVATLQLEHADREVSEIRFRIDPERHGGFTADGELEVDPPFAYWRPPPEGGRFTLEVRIDRDRRNGGFDAHINENWTILRFDHLFPAARVRGRSGAVSKSTLELTVPDGWSVETRYRRFEGEPLSVDTPDRRYSRPTGWVAAGQLGVRREQIAGREVSVAGPVQHCVRRMDHLALMQWTLPALLEVFPAFPESVLVVSAGDPMWRGALSGPSSLYIHAERPLINERGTSTLLHELVHVAGISGTGPGASWIVEGLADDYSLEALHRSGADGAASLDDVARVLAERGETITLERFRVLSEQAAGAPLAEFDALPLREPAPPTEMG